MRHLVLFVALMCGCADNSIEPQVSVPKAENVGVSSSFRLPVSINDVMVALVNDAANPIWVAAWHQPSSDAEWNALERRAYQLKLAGSLIAYPGTGGLDDKWAAKPAWRRWSNELRDAGTEAIEAVESRDLERIGLVGDRIVEVCEGCHIEFKLPYPTGGKFGELAPTEMGLESP